VSEQSIKDKLASQYESEIYDGMKTILGVSFFN